MNLKNRKIFFWKFEIYITTKFYLLCTDAKKAAVELEEFLEAVCKFGKSLNSHKLPAYSDQFYVNMSLELERKTSAQNIYPILRNNRNGWRTKVFEKLDIADPEVANPTENINVRVVEDSFDFSYARIIS